VFLDQAAVRKVRPADVALTAGSVAGGAVIVECLLHPTVLKIGTARLQCGIIAVQDPVQAICYYLRRVHMADGADPVLVLKGISHEVLMGCLHIPSIIDSAVAPDAVLRVVDRGQELAAYKELLPCLQRRQFASSPLTAAFF